MSSLDDVMSKGTKGKQGINAGNERVREWWEEVKREEELLFSLGQKDAITTESS